ncbi:MAG: hypothetical protein ABF319_03970, partial [Polaribacter sp.]
MKNTLKILFFTVITLFLVNCARTSRPDGGPRDEDAPLMVTATPPYENINFEASKIKLSFNEFI